MHLIKYISSQIIKTYTCFVPWVKFSEICKTKKFKPITLVWVLLTFWSRNFTFKF